MASGLHLAVFLCLIGGLLISGTGATRVKRATGCPSGWSSYGSRCFIVMANRRTMAEAEQICLSHGGNLASIRSFWEHWHIRNLIFRKFHSHPTTWIGLYDAIQEGRWMWTDGSRITFTRWGHREPNNKGGEDCAEINFRSYFWNDIPCGHHKPFVCARTR
ncbi:galactose-specific lectin nattectin-like [Pempheris klunzingeri]|uniref:galactose-specific lectin nattectin-like n=1 Tax=Pempheris klunzingeri TaxID=3127111 RepID=UPI00397FE2AD